VTRGPQDPVPLPPADLATRRLPIVELPAGTALRRIHRTANPPIHCSAGPGRFDSPAGRFGVLYAARGFDGAFAETILRNPARRLVSLREIEARSLAVLALGTTVRLVDLTGPGLSALGLDARFLSGPYDPCGAWAEALAAHAAAPGGILYPSRFDPSEHCVALFDRPAPLLAPRGPGQPLGTMPAAVGAALDRYGKALDVG
jgi:hypothetical protein